jgi:hypothetical protein
LDASIYGVTPRKVTPEIRWLAFIEHYAVDTITKNDRIDIRHAIIPVIAYPPCMPKFVEET